MTSFQIQIVYGRIRTCEAFYAVDLKPTPFDRSGTYTYYTLIFFLSLIITN